MGVENPLFPTHHSISSSPHYQSIEIDLQGHIKRTSTEVMTKLTTQLDDYTSEKHSLKMKIQEGEQIVKILQNVLLRSSHVYDEKGDINLLDEEVKNLALKTYGIFAKNFHGNNNLLIKYIGTLLKEQMNYVQALKEAKAKLEASKPKMEPIEIKKAEEIAERIPLEEVELSVHYALEYMKNNSEDPIIQNLKPGEFFTLSRKKVFDESGKQVLPRSVDIIKCDDESYQFLVHVHQRAKVEEETQGQKSYEEKIGEGKLIAAGGQNYIYSGYLVESHEGHILLSEEEAVRRVPQSKAVHPTAADLVAMKRQQSTEDALFGEKYIDAPLSRPASIEPKDESSIKSARGGLYRRWASNSYNHLHATGSKIAIQSLEKPLRATQKWLDFCQKECMGFQTMHEHGIAHMDGSQKNIGVDQNGDPIISDFDTCLHFYEPISDELTDVKIAGTRGWFPPEMGKCMLGQEPAVEQAMKNFREGKGTDDDRQVIMNFYFKVDDYIQSMNLYLKMTGELPPMYKNFSWGPIAKNHADVPENAAIIKEQLEKAVKKGKWPKEIAEMVKNGLSSDPTNRPSMAKYIEAFESAKKGELESQSGKIPR